MKFRIVVLISGRGSNLESLIKTSQRESCFHISRVFSDKPEAKGLLHAHNASIPTTSLRPKEFSSKKDFFEELTTQINAESPNLVVLAGFMRILPISFIRAFSNRIINIHPSLLPKFPGLNTHQRALEAGESRHGATVHIVDSGVDTGPVIAQVSCHIEPQDTAQTLAERLLSHEHRLLSWVVTKLADGDACLEPSIWFSETALEQARNQGFVVADF
jgi:phosphoribosylglycinamide formyltransferase-1